MQAEAMTEVRSTLKRPAEKLIRQFHVGQVGDDTIQTFLMKGFSLAICCQDWPRHTEWTPPELERRFGDKLGLRIADLVPRLACTGELGCGSHSVAVFPHLYDGEWSWAHP
jgi:hypothetical protein